MTEEMVEEEHEAEQEVDLRAKSRERRAEKERIQKSEDRIKKLEFSPMLRGMDLSEMVWLD